MRGGVAGRRRWAAGRDGPRPGRRPHRRRGDATRPVADLVARCRTAVERDYQGKPEWAHALEAPTRLAKYLWQMVRGALAIGVERDEALRLAVRVAGDSMPQVRLDVLLMVQEVPDQTSWQYSKLLQLPRTTVDRTLQELHLLSAVEVEVSDEVSTKADGYGETGPVALLDQRADRRERARSAQEPEERTSRKVSRPPAPSLRVSLRRGPRKGALCPPTDTSGRSGGNGSTPHSARTAPAAEGRSTRSTPGSGTTRSCAPRPPRRCSDAMRSQDEPHHRRQARASPSAQAVWGGGDPRSSCPFLRRLGGLGPGPLTNSDNHLARRGLI